ncbi:MAG: M23 family metallopeptidase [Chloroflexi bacterium]|nr:M23 family metallopeptidase [Chloroflexota bacterium]
MIFGKRGFAYRLLFVHFAHTFSLSYFFRLIATLIGSYSRSRRAAQARNAAAGGQVLRRIYGHIVAQGLGAEKLTAAWEMPGFPRRNLGAAGQIGMASVIVLLAWIYWPGEAAAPALSSAIGQPIAGQLTSPVAASASNDAASASANLPSAQNASPQQIAATKERFSALTSQQVESDRSVTIAHSEPLPFGAEIEDAPALPVSSPEEAETDPRAAEAESSASDVSATSSRPESLANLLASLAEMTAEPREAVSQAVAGVGELATGTRKTSRTAVEAQHTSTPPPPAQPTPAPAIALVPGPQWAEFTPAAAPDVDHFWLGQPHPSGYDQLYSPNYQFGSTAGNRYRIHHGVDISNNAGAPVLAMGEGEVVHAGPDNPALLGPYNNFYGNAVVIRLNRRLPTPEGEQDVYVLLGHMSEVYVERGQQVTPDVVVGAVGMTGIAIGPHLHVEVRVGQNSYLDSVNPALWMQNAPGAGAVAARLLTADGHSWPLARLSLLRYEGGGTRWVRTLEIYPDAENIHGDPAWGENGALSNLAAGAYWIGGVVNGEKFGQNITINSGETTFVELRTQQ